MVFQAKLFYFYFCGRTHRRPRRREHRPCAVYPEGSGAEVEVLRKNQQIMNPEATSEKIADSELKFSVKVKDVHD